MPYTGGSADANPVYGPHAVDTNDLRAVELGDAGRGIDPTGGGGGGAVDSVNGQTGVVVLDIPESSDFEAGGADPITNLAIPFDLKDGVHSLYQFFVSGDYTVLDIYAPDGTTLAAEFIHSAAGVGGWNLYGADTSTASEWNALGASWSIATLPTVLIDSANRTIQINNDSDGSPVWMLAGDGSLGAVAPNDGDVATWDAGGGKWVAAAGGGGSGLLQSATVHLSAAEITTLHSAPTTLVAAPGAGKIVVAQSAFVEFNAGVTTYIGVGGLSASFAVGDFRFALAAAEKAILGAASGVDQAALEYAADTIMRFAQLPYAFDAIETTLRTVGENQPLILWANAGLPPGYLGNEDPAAFGTITTSAKVSGGSGYAPGDTGTIDGDTSPVGNPATYTVLTVSAGAVATYSVTNHDPGYNSLSNPFATTATTGGGSGFTLNVTAIPPADGDLYVTVDYRVIDLH